MVKLTICYAKVNVDSSEISSVSLRGYLGYLFTNDPEFHHHSEKSHHYPKIQYKKIGGQLLVVGISEYAHVLLERLSNVEHITTIDKKIPIQNLQLETKTFTICQAIKKYRFATPWIGLNETNYTKYTKLIRRERSKFLEKILIGNILSMCKGLGIHIDFKINIKISKIKTKTVTVHENKFAGIFCDWETNIALPELCGLGKSVSKGFGVIKSIDS